jgi:hypothetical protein
MISGDMSLYYNFSRHCLFTWKTASPAGTNLSARFEAVSRVEEWGEEELSNQIRKT